MQLNLLPVLSARRPAMDDYCVMVIFQPVVCDIGFMNRCFIYASNLGNFLVEAEVCAFNLMGW